MKSNAILTTTVGSFPRPKALVGLLWEKEMGGTADISASVQDATTDIVKSQVEAGLDFVSNGEQGRLAFASWVPKRLTGFSGEDTPFLIKDLEAFPEFAQRLWSTHSPHFPHTPMCVGPIAYQPNDVQQELEQFRVALQTAPATGFFTSTSPGNIALIYQDQHYHNHETYLSSIAQAMKEEFKLIAAEYLLQIDEAANPRHAHEWRVFEEIKLPDGKILVPGVIDSTTNFIEHPDLVAERIVRFARLVGRERVIAGVDCGFATMAGLHTVDPKIAWAKLQSLAEGARLASQQMW